MVLLALDQSSRINGYSIFKDNKLIYTGKLTFTSEEVGKRLQHLRESIKDIIFQYDVDTVIYEDIQLQSNIVNNVQTFKVLAQVQGVIEELLTELHLPHSTVLASCWKSALGIQGKTRAEQKKNAQAYILKKYNIKATQDEADACCIGEYYFIRNKNNWTI